jgi:hypothetical protein
MRLTEEAQASAATPTSTDVGPTPPSRQSWRPSRKVLIAAAVTVGVLVGGTGGYVAYRISTDPQERSRLSVESGSDRHLVNLSNEIQSRRSVESGSDRHLVNLSNEIQSRRSLDAQSARWQAQADAYLAQQQAVERGRAGDSARWQAQADAYLAQQQAVERGRAADSARWQAQADAYLAQQQAVERGRAADTASPAE